MRLTLGAGSRTTRLEAEGWRAGIRPKGGEGARAALWPPGRGALDLFAWALALAVALGLKLFYRSASAEALRPILLPTVLVFERLTGEAFVFEAGQGYVSRALHFEVAPVCAGLNFLVAAFLTLFAGAGSLRRGRRALLTLPLALAVAYLTTIVVNALRLVLVLELRRRPEWRLGLSESEAHRLIGIAVYFGGLLALFAAFDRLVPAASDHVRLPSGSRARAGSNEARGHGPPPRPRVDRTLLFPLLGYWTVTLALPLLTLILRPDGFDALLVHGSWVLIGSLTLTACGALLWRLLRGARPSPDWTKMGGWGSTGAAEAKLGPPRRSDIS